MARCMRDHVIRYFPLAERACVSQVADLGAQPGPIAYDAQLQEMRAAAGRAANSRGPNL